MIKKTTYGVMDTKVFDQVTGIMNNAADEQDLLEINRWIITRLKAMRTAKNMTAAATLKVGMIVEWNGRRGYHKGEVIKINRTRAQVKEDHFMTWNVPMTMLKIVK